MWAQEMRHPQRLWGKGGGEGERGVLKKKIAIGKMDKHKHGNENGNEKHNNVMKSKNKKQNKLGL